MIAIPYPMDLVSETKKAKRLRCLIRCVALQSKIAFIRCDLWWYLDVYPFDFLKHRCYHYKLTYQVWTLKFGWLPLSLSSAFVGYDMSISWPWPLTFELCSVRVVHCWCSVDTNFKDSVTFRSYVRPIAHFMPGIYQACWSWHSFDTDLWPLYINTVSRDKLAMCQM